MQNTTTNPSHGVRSITLEDQAPQCEILVNRTCYTLEEVCRDKDVVDIGCGYGRFRSVVEGVGGRWTGVEPFGSGERIVQADAEKLPFADSSFDVAIMHAVMEHIPDVSKAISECARVLRPGGVLVGYVAFMECFHEVSYSHLSFKALEHFATVNGMRLERVAGGHRFGMDYHFHVLMYPLPVRWMRPLMAAWVRGWIKLKSRLAYMGLRYRRRMPRDAAKAKAQLWYQVECLRLSQGFDFVIRKRA